METSRELIPAVASLAETETSVLETYQPFFPVVPLKEILREGVVVSTETVVEEFEVFPALSDALTETLYTPSYNVVDDCQAPPLMESDASARPEVESEPVVDNVTGETNQPFVPFEPLISSPMLGGTVSTIAESVPIVELSPQEERAK